MSIKDEINARIAEGRLHHLQPLLGSVDRTMLVSSEVKEFVCGPWKKSSDELRALTLRAFLDQFSNGRPISIAASPYKKPNDTYLAPIDPVKDRVYSLRNRDKPSIRLLGCFAEKDVFVALVWEYRTALETPFAWRNLRERCKAEWRSLFNTYSPMSGEDRDQLATNVIYY